MKLLRLLEQEQGLTSQMFTLSVIIVTLLHLLRLKSSSPFLQTPCNHLVLSPHSGVRGLLSLA